MVSETVLIVLQYGSVFAMCVIFSLLALDRETLLSNLIASLMWLVLALVNFMVGYTLVGTAISYVFGVICFIFMGGFIMSMLDGITEPKRQRFKMGGF